MQKDHTNFATRAKAILGHGWQRRWARACELSESTVWRWANGHQPVPTAAVALLELLESAEDLPARWRKA